MKVIMAKKSGFCFGVKRAVDMALKATEMHTSLYSYGQLIHNDQVSQRLSEKGLLETNDISLLTEMPVVIRSHGVGKDVYDLSKKNNLDLIDCTCPFVKKVHQIVDEYYKKGYTIIVVGDDQHPEVMGINGWCENQAIIINHLKDIPPLNSKHYCVVAQTTIKKNVWDEIVLRIKEMNVEAEFFNTICSATSERQEAAMILAKEVDCMIVIGGRHSSNTVKLYEICKSICKNTILIEKKSDLVMTKLINCGIIGITAGASTPDWVIHEIYEYLTHLDL